MGYKAGLSLCQDDEGDYLAHFVELPSVYAFAGTSEEVLHELAEAWTGVQAGGCCRVKRNLIGI